MVIWLIGMSGSGKTTVGRILDQEIKALAPNTVFLDGDILRDVWGDSLGHTVEARAVNAHRLSHLSRVLDEQGINVVAAVLSIFPDWQKWNRETFSDYYEIFMDEPVEELQRRDPKGIYAARRDGETDNVVGIDIPFPRPENADVTFQASKTGQSPEDIASIIVAEVKDRLKQVS